MLQNLPKPPHWAITIPLILLITVALRQLYLVETIGLNRWKGGGFGMFSQISERSYHIHLINKGTIDCITPAPKKHKKTARKLLHFPYPNHLAQFTQNLTKETWVYFKKIAKKNITKGVFMLPKQQSLSAQHSIAPVDTIQVSVFNASFNPETNTLTPILIRTTTQNK